MPAAGSWGQLWEAAAGVPGGIRVLQGLWALHSCSGQGWSCCSHCRLCAQLWVFWAQPKAGLAFDVLGSGQK